MAFKILLSSLSTRRAFLAAFLNGRKPMLEGVHVAWRAAFAL